MNLSLGYTSPSMGTQRDWVSYGIDSISRSGVATSSQVLRSKPSASQTSRGSTGPETGKYTGIVPPSHPGHIQIEENRMCSESQVLSQEKNGTNRKCFRKTSRNWVDCTTGREVWHNITIPPSRFCTLHLLHSTSSPAAARTLVWAETPPHILVWAVSRSPNN